MVSKIFTIHKSVFVSPCYLKHDKGVHLVGPKLWIYGQFHFRVFYVSKFTLLSAVFYFLFGENRTFRSDQSELYHASK